MAFQSGLDFSFVALALGSHRDNCERLIGSICKEPSQFILFNIRMKFKGFPPLLLAIAIVGGGVAPVKAAPPAIKHPAPQHLAQAQPPALNEDQILALMKQISEAEAKEDVDTLMSFLAPFVVSDVTVQSGNQRTTRTVEGLSAHRQMLQSSYDQRVSNEILNENMQVDFDDDGNIAIVTRYSIETFQLKDDREFISMAKDVIRFALVDGQPKIISVVVDGWSEERP